MSERAEAAMITVAAWAINNRNALHNSIPKPKIPGEWTPQKEYPEEEKFGVGDLMAIAYLTGIIDMAALYKEFSEKGELLETMRRMEDKLNHYLKIEEENEDKES
jgi:hypothetical protein